MPQAVQTGACRYARLASDTPPDTCENSLSGSIAVRITDPEIRDIAVRWLEEEGYTTTLFETCDEAGAQIESVQPNVFLVDIAGGGDEGLDAIRRLRAVTRSPILVIGDSDCDERPLKALDLGADDYICRTPNEETPLARKELLSRLGVALRRASDTKSPGGEIVAGPIRITLDTHTVCVDGEEVALTPNEFRLLTALASDPGRVFTHQELLERIWGAYATQRVNYLHVYVDRVRKRIERDPDGPRRLISVRGVGYKLVLPAGA